jgi:L-amino acid N-acyltransferase YncA/DNA-binding transcriptional ArsR family regulator
MKIDRDSAHTYARWFQALSDPTRVVICNLLADAGRPMTVGEIVRAVDIGQSTVSHHLKLLAEVGFVQATPQGTARLYRFNQRCVEAFPTAAELVLGRLPGEQPENARSGPGRLHGGPEDVRIEPLRPNDWPAVAAIYAEGIATGNATFETAPPSWEHWDSSHLADHRLVARIGGDQHDGVVAWAALAPVSDRCVYGGVAENSIYVAERARGLGVGRSLLTALVERAEQADIWTVQTGVFPENTASLALHHRCGFRVVGVRERPGRLHGRWRDVVMLERRSAVAGV